MEQNCIERVFHLPIIFILLILKTKQDYKRQIIFIKEPVLTIGGGWSLAIGLDTRKGYNNNSKSRGWS